MIACWTNFEIRKLVEMHRERTPSIKELAAAFPRHTFSSVRAAAWEHDLRHRRNGCLQWLKIAHLHFSKRGGEA